MLKIVHAADLHIDSPLCGLSRYEGAPTGEIRAATRMAFCGVVQLAIVEDAAAVVIAGDVFDGDWRDFNTGLFFVEQMRLLNDAGIPVVIVRGNHDAASQISRRLTLPPNTRILSASEPESVILEDRGLALHGQSFASRAVRNNIALAYPAPTSGLTNVGILHTALTGRTGHDPYAPCSVDDLRRLGYHYMALGHVHAREVVSQDPWIVVPGNTQGRDARELGEKGVTVVTFDDSEVVSVEHRAVDVVRWTQIDVDATGAAGFDDIVEAVERQLDEAEAAGNGRLVAARVVLSGSTPVNARLRGDADRVAAEVRALARGRIWIEKVRIETRAAGAVDAASQVLVKPLLETVDAALADVEVLGQLFAVLEPLRSKLPPSLPKSLVDLGDVDAVKATVLEASEYLIALLSGSRR